MHHFLIFLERRRMGWKIVICRNDGYFCDYWISMFWGTIPHSNHGLDGMCVDGGSMMLVNGCNGDTKAR